MDDEMIRRCQQHLVEFTARARFRALLASLKDHPARAEALLRALLLNLADKKVRGLLVPEKGFAWALDFYADALALPVNFSDEH